jgi:CubicO group peptidase (beta-lactamase class C family)
MRFLRLVVALLGTSVSLPLPAGAASVPESPVADLGAVVAPIVAARGVPGLAVVVLKGDRIVAQGVAGVRRAGRADPLSLQDQFLICSATKAMTATLAARAVEEGRLSWSSSVRETLGSSLSGIRSEWDAATLAQLLEHRSGVPADTSRIWTLIRVEFFSRKDPAHKRELVVRRVLSHRPAYAPGTGYIYSTLDYLIVAAMLEKVYGRPWETLIRERLWEPLGIVEAGFGAPEAKNGRGAYGHLGILLPGHAVKPGGFWSRLTMPAGFNMARMTLAEWAKFVAIHLKGDPDNPHHQATLLTPESFAALHAVSREKFYEGGWFRAELPWQGHGNEESTRVLSSQGDNYVWHVEAWLMPAMDTAVLIACNEGGPTSGKPAALASRDLLQALREGFLAAP